MVFTPKYQQEKKVSWKKKINVSQDVQVFADESLLDF